MPPPLRRRSPAPTSPIPSAWTPEKIEAVLSAFRSFVQNSARKHGVDPSEVASLVFDHLADPGD